MRNITLVVATAIVLSAGSAPGFADNAGSSTMAVRCANILANPDAHGANLVAYCRDRQKRQTPGAIRAAPAIRDDGPTISLPG